MKELEVFRTSHWVISHRSDSRYPGYLIASSKDKIDDFQKLTAEAMSDLKIALTKAERLVILVYGQSKAIIAKLGQHEKIIHFHIVPISSILAKHIAHHPQYSTITPEEKRILLYVNKEYCEIPLNEQQKEEILLEVSALRKKHEEL